MYLRDKFDQRHKKVLFVHICQQNTYILTKMIKNYYFIKTLHNLYNYKFHNNKTVVELNSDQGDGNIH
jgi:hypothetical protein